MSDARCPLVREIEEFAAGDDSSQECAQARRLVDSWMWESIRAALETAHVMRAALEAARVMRDGIQSVEFELSGKTLAAMQAYDEATRRKP